MAQLNLKRVLEVRREEKSQEEEGEEGEDGEEGEEEDDTSALSISPKSCNPPALEMTNDKMMNYK